jgi:hypothetical protein
MTNNCKQVRNAGMSDLAPIFGSGLLPAVSRRGLPKHRETGSFDSTYLQKLVSIITNPHQTEGGQIVC